MGSFCFTLLVKLQLFHLVLGMMGAGVQGGGHTVVKKSQNCAEIPKIVFGATMQFWLKTNYIMIQNKEYKTIFLNFKHFVP